MNSLSARMRAIAVTALAFAFAAAALTWMLHGLERVPALLDLLPGAAPDPSTWIAILLGQTQLRLLTGLFLVVGAAVLCLQSTYLDRMFEIFGDVILMMIAALIGAVGGTWLALRILGAAPAVSLGALAPLLILAAIVFVAVLFVPHRARGAIVLRIVTIVIMLAAAPALIAFAGW